MSQEILQELSGLLGGEHVVTDDAERRYFAMDVYNAREMPLAVIRPGTVEELQEAARIALRGGLALVPRGGGASYTDGYLPATAHSLLVDTSRLNRIIEINATDMYVTVEPAVTWERLNAALAKEKLRTPFWGPFSGLKATVGGSTSQNSASLGTGNHGLSAESVLSFDVVLGNGELLRTGSASISTSTPFFRWYGPDLTGLFTGDTGAMGIKARITLRLIRRPPKTGTASFGFDSFGGMAAGMSAVARLGVVADNYGLDPKLQQGQLTKTNTSDAARAVWNVARDSSNPLEAARRLARMALAGKRFFGGFSHSVHYVVEGHSAAEVKTKLKLVRETMRPHGTEIANTVPTVLRAMPFIPMYSVLGVKGERWVPMHGIMPFSRVAEFRRRLVGLYEENASRMKELRVDKGAMFMTVSSNAFLYEPVFYWEDSQTVFHKRFMPQDYLKTLPEHDENPEGRALVAELRRKILDIFWEVGAIHLQVGKTYPYLRGRQPEAERLLRAFKSGVDPDNLMNPGALGLGAP
ncbi:MAG: FAD-binding oxidoreductase [Gammaproteobacteria bacterium]|nr:FAD-binding oxidoreductase [Gammaproteobacteria bacterium]